MQTCLINLTKLEKYPNSRAPSWQGNIAVHWDKQGCAQKMDILTVESAETITVRVIVTIENKCDESREWNLFTICFRLGADMEHATSTTSVVV